jgi:hypothetical protein
MTSATIPTGLCAICDRWPAHQRCVLRGHWAGRAPKLSAPIVALAATLCVTDVSAASAEILFLNDASSATSYASAAADGAAYAFGDEASAYASSDAHSESTAFSMSDGAKGGVAVAQSAATGSFIGFGMGVTSVTSAPITDSHGAAMITTTTTTEIETFEFLRAYVSDFEDMTSQFASASQATFSFTTASEAVYQGAVFTRISSTSTTIEDAKGAAAAPNGATAVEAIRTIPKSGAGTVATTFRPSSNPIVVVTGQASAEASSGTSSDYTFEVLGDRPETIAVRYGGRGDAPVSYEIDLVNEATSSALGTQDWIGSSPQDEEIWTIASPGVYSLIIDAYSSLSGSGALFGGARDYESGSSQGVFEMNITPVPELQTSAMMLIGLATLGLSVFRRRLAASWR